MRYFWDTSAVINAAVSVEVANRLDTDEHAARAHMLSEFFSRLTGRGIRALDAAGNQVEVQFDPDEAAEWLRNFSKKVTILELEGSDVLSALDKARSLGVTGARVYDYHHAVAAQKWGADVVLTRNTSHFIGLTGKARLEWP